MRNHGRFQRSHTRRPRLGQPESSSWNGSINAATRMPPSPKDDCSFCWPLLVFSLPQWPALGLGESRPVQQNAWSRPWLASAGPTMSWRGMTQMVGQFRRPNSKLLLRATHREQQYGTVSTKRRWSLKTRQVSHEVRLELGLGTERFDDFIPAPEPGTACVSLRDPADRLDSSTDHGCGFRSSSGMLRCGHCLGGEYCRS